MCATIHVLSPIIMSSADLRLLASYDTALSANGSSFPSEEKSYEFYTVTCKLLKAFLDLGVWMAHAPHMHIHWCLLLIMA